MKPAAINDFLNSAKSKNQTQLQVQTNNHFFNLTGCSYDRSNETLAGIQDNKVHIIDRNDIISLAYII